MAIMLFVCCVESSFFLSFFLIYLLIECNKRDAVRYVHIRTYIHPYVHYIYILTYLHIHTHTNSHTGICRM